MAEPTASPADHSLEERLRLIESLLLRLLANEPALRSPADLVPSQSVAREEIVSLSHELQELKAVVQALPNWVVSLIDEHKAAVASSVSQSSDDFRRLRLDTAEALQLLAQNDAIVAPKKKPRREAGLVASRRRIQKKNPPNGAARESGRSLRVSQ
jgi:hypothetical protein